MCRGGRSEVYANRGRSIHNSADGAARRGRVGRANSEFRNTSMKLQFLARVHTYRETMLIFKKALSCTAPAARAVSRSRRAAPRRPDCFRTLATNQDRSWEMLLGFARPRKLRLTHLRTKPRNRLGFFILLSLYPLI